MGLTGLFLSGLKRATGAAFLSDPRPNIRLVFDKPVVTFQPFVVQYFLSFLFAQHIPDTSI